MIIIHDNPKIPRVQSASQKNPGMVLLDSELYNLWSLEYVYAVSWCSELQLLVVVSWANILRYFHIELNLLLHPTGILEFRAAAISRKFAESLKNRGIVFNRGICLGQALYYNLLSCTCVKLTKFQSFPIRNEIRYFDTSSNSIQCMSGRCCSIYWYILFHFYDQLQNKKHKTLIFLFFSS